MISILLANSDGRANNSDAGNTGAPCEDGLVCSSCHFGGGLGPTTEEFKLIDPITSQEVFNYAPGKLYNAEIKVVPIGVFSRYGFQATALDTSNLEAGTWTNESSSVQISEAGILCGSGRRTYVEHTAPFFLSTFKIDWLAPNCDIGPVTFYFIGNAVNNDSSTSGDRGGSGSSTTYSAQYPQIIAIDSSDIPPGAYLSGGYISIKGNIINNNQVILGAVDSTVVIGDFEVSLGSEYINYTDNCIE